MSTESRVGNILLVDGHPAHLLALKVTLAPLGHRLVKATTARDALRWLLREDFAAVVMAVRLEGLGGVEAAALIRQRERCQHTPLLLLTATDAEEREVLPCYALGALDSMRKPFEPEVLRARVSLMVERSLAREEVKHQAARLRELEGRRLMEGADRERLHALFEQSPAAIAVTRGPDFIFEFANPLYEKIIGRRVVPGSPLRVVLPEVLSQPGVMEVLRRVMRTGEPFVGREFPVSLDRHGDGTLEEAYFDLVYQPLRDAHGRVEALLTHSVEVTAQVWQRRQVEALAEDLRRGTQALRASEERLSLALAAAELGTWDFRPLTGELRWDARCKVLFGLPLDAEVRQESFYAGLHPEDGEPTREAIARALDPAGTGEFDFEYRTVSPLDGVERWVHSTGRAYFEGGRAVRFTGVVQDITQRHRLYREAREAVRLRDDFLSIASHELRTPLTPLQLKLQGLRRELDVEGTPAPLRARSVRALEGAEAQVRKLTDLVNSLLDVSRISAGRLEVEREPVDFAELLRDVASRFAPQAHKAACALEVEAPQTLVGRWNRMRLEQVVTNLLTNALKYGAGQPVALRLKGEGPEARLEVVDRGIGIAPEDQRRIFERFERAVHPRHYGGLGLGLYITRQIVEALGGAISVHSAPGQGARFEVRLPGA